jgi:integrase
MASKTIGKRSRGNGEGSIYQRESDGKWCASLTLDAGKRKVVYGNTRAEVAKKLANALHARAQHIPTPPQRLTVGKLLDEWVERDLKQRPLTRTQESYEYLIRVHLKPALGRRRLAELTVRDVEEFLQAKASEQSALGRPDSASTLRSLRAVLSGALTYAQRLDLAHRNVAHLARIPATRAPKARTAMTPELARMFLDKIRDHRLEALYAVAMAIGLRQAEALGLRWSDVNVDQGQVHVRVQLSRIEGQHQLRPPKRHQTRTIKLPAVSITALREHRKRQIEERLAAGNRWQDWDLVFPSRYGTPMDRCNVSHRFQELLDRLGLPKLVFHELRHTCSSLLLAQGVHPRVVMEILGHSQMSTTTDTYSHVPPELLDEAARQMNDALVGSG